MSASHDIPHESHDPCEPRVIPEPHQPFESHWKDAAVNARYLHTSFLVFLLFISLRCSPVSVADASHHTHLVSRGRFSHRHLCRCLQPHLHVPVEQVRDQHPGVVGVAAVPCRDRAERWHLHLHSIQLRRKSDHLLQSLRSW